MVRTVKRAALGAVVLIAGVAVLTAVSLRLFISHEPSRWHIDPMTVDPASEANADLITPPSAPKFAVEPLQLRSAVGEVMALQPRTRLLATSEDGALRTWVTTSAVMAFPDYTSILVLPVGEDPNSSTLAIYARPRFGRNDFGVNRDRNSEILRGLLERVGSVG
ncbi:MAG: DUF1499 domain-containing protein [Acidimicrobiales bacterium]